MIVVGLTGGIGSGKTTVAGFFKTLGIPVYIADDEAKKLMNTAQDLVAGITELFGPEAYKNHKLNRPFIAETIFNDAALLQQMNALVHPKVAEHFKQWANKQIAPYVIKEAAVLFENGSYKSCDFTITVTADEAVRMARVLKRDHTTEKKVKAIMENQWPDDKKIALSDFVIENTDLEATKKQVVEIHQTILKSMG